MRFDVLVSFSQANTKQERKEKNVTSLKKAKTLVCRRDVFAFSPFWNFQTLPFFLIKTFFSSKTYSKQPPNHIKHVPLRLKTSKDPSETNSVEARVETVAMAGEAMPLLTVALDRQEKLGLMGEELAGGVLVGWLGGWVFGWLVGWVGGWVGGWLVGWVGGCFLKSLRGSEKGFEMSSLDFVVGRDLLQSLFLDGTRTRCLSCAASKERRPSGDIRGRPVRERSARLLSPPHSAVWRPFSYNTETMGFSVCKKHCGCLEAYESSKQTQPISVGGALALEEEIAEDCALRLLAKRCRAFNCGMK